MDVPHMANPAVAFTRRADVEGFVAIATVGHSLLAANVAGVGAFGLADIALALADSVGEFASSVPLLLLLRRNRERNCIHCYQVLTLYNRLVVLRIERVIIPLTTSSTFLSINCSASVQYHVSGSSSQGLVWDQRIHH